MAERVISEIAIRKPETRTLRLTVDKPIELTLGNGHVFKLRRGDDGVARLSIDGLSDEVELPPNASVDIRRGSALADNGLDLTKAKNYDESLGRRVVDYHINLPDRAVNPCGQKIDFTDIGDRPFSGLSILIGVAGRRAGDNMVVITNHDGGLGVAEPVKTTP